MKYMGSKNRIAKYILPIMLKDRKEGQWWVEPFVGGGNMIDKVDGNRIGSDYNEYLICLLKKLQDGWLPPTVNREEYLIVKKNKKTFPKHIVGWCGFGCSYNGVWFSGYSGEIITKEGKRRHYQEETIRNINKQFKSMVDVDFVCRNYCDLAIPKNSIIYCDPPYKGTSGYKDVIDHDKFWKWCRGKVKEGHTVFISEYNAPDDFECIWSKEIVSSLTKNTGAKKGVEKLFIYKG